MARRPRHRSGAAVHGAASRRDRTRPDRRGGRRPDAARPRRGRRPEPRADHLPLPARRPRHGRRPGRGQLPRDDGLVLAPEHTRADAIRDDDEHAGVRDHLVYTLATAQLAFHVDVNVGDPVHPEPQDIYLPALLGGSITLRGYPMVTAMAEKIVTAMQRGAANTRWRDYADVLLLARDHPVHGTDLHAALSAVATHCDVTLTPLVDLLDDYPDLAQNRWA